MNLIGHAIVDYSLTDNAHPYVVIFCLSGFKLSDIPIHLNVHDVKKNCIKYIYLLIEQEKFLLKTITKKYVQFRLQTTTCFLQVIVNSAITC